MDNNPNDGSKVGLFLRAPDAVAAMRGALPEDDSPAHVTFLILGDLRPFGGPEVLLDALRAAITNHPSRCWAVLDRVRVSTNTQGQKVAWQEVYFEDGGFGPRSWPSLCRMREALVADLRGVRGLPIKDHSPDRWTPHFTRAYLPPDVLAYTDEPIWAAWQVNQIEVWGYGAPLCVDLRTGGLVPSRDLAFELAKALSPHRTPGPRIAHRVPSWLGALLMAHQGLHKGASHKYIRKVPTGKAGKSGKPTFRYYYTVGGGAGLGHHDEFKVGAAFAVKDAGKAGHFHITEDHGDSVTIKHDESGKSSRVAKDALRSMLHNEHAEALGAAKERAAKTLEQAKKTGTKKQQEKAAALVSKYGGAKQGASARLARIEIDGEKIFEGLPEKVNAHPVVVEDHKDGILISYVNDYGGPESILVLNEPRKSDNRMSRRPTVAIMWGKRSSSTGEHLSSNFLIGEINGIKNFSEGPEGIINYHRKMILENIPRRDYAPPKLKPKYQEEINDDLEVIAKYGGDTNMPGAREPLPEQELEQEQELAPPPQGSSIMDRLRRNRTEIDPKTQAAINKNAARQQAAWEAFKTDPRPVHIVLRDAVANITRKTEGGLMVRQDLATHTILDLTKPEMEEMLKLIAFDVIKNRQDAQQLAYKFRKNRDLKIDYQAREKLLDAFSDKGLSEYMKKNGKAHKATGYVPPTTPPTLTKSLANLYGLAPSRA